MRLRLERATILKSCSSSIIIHLHVNRSLNCLLEVVQCISIIMSDQALLFWLLLFSDFIFVVVVFFFFFFLIKRRKRNEILSNSLSADPIKWLFSQFYNCNLIKHNYLHYQYVKFIGKNKNKKQVRKKRFYTSALSCLRISILARDSGRSSQRRTAHGHWPAVNLKEGMSNLFLFPIFRECASPLFLNLLQRRGGASLLTYFK